MYYNILIFDQYNCIQDVYLKSLNLFFMQEVNNQHKKEGQLKLSFDQNKGELKGKIISISTYKISSEKKVSTKSMNKEEIYTAILNRKME